MCCITSHVQQHTGLMNRLQGSLSAADTQSSSTPSSKSATSPKGSSSQDCTHRHAAQQQVLHALQQLPAPTVLEPGILEQALPQLQPQLQAQPQL